MKKPLLARIAKLEKEMDALHAQKAALDALVADPASYAAEHKVKLADAVRQLGEIGNRLGDIEADWLGAHEELEQIG